MNEATEGNPSVEAAEQRTLGTTTYEKAEVVHQFADTHPWLHPLLIVVGIAIFVGLIFGIRHLLKK